VITQTTVLQTTRQINAADWAVTIAHWLWVVPKYVHAVAMMTATAGESYSYWYSNFTTEWCTYQRWRGTGSYEVSMWNSATKAIYIENSGSTTATRSNIQTADISADATNITLTWDYTDSSWGLTTDIIYVTLFVHA
jgi:hypothetical protein